MLKNNRAFTLIELLVVVLIIGILAAIALPQYQVAVAKTKTVQLFARMDALRKSAETYLLANGVWPNDVRDLDIDIGAQGAEYKKSDDTSVDNMSIYYPDGSFCGVWASPAGNRGVMCKNTDVYIPFYQNLTPQWRCRGLTDLGTKVCKSMGGAEQGNNYFYLP